MYGELWNRIKDFITSINNNPYDYDKKYVKIKFNLDDDLAQKKH